MEEDNRAVKSLLVGFDRIPGKDIATLIVGVKKENEPVEIINAFENEEAIELYEKLITRRNYEETVTE